MIEESRKRFNRILHIVTISIPIKSGYSIRIDSILKNFPKGKVYHWVACGVFAIRHHLPLTKQKFKYPYTNYILLPGLFIGNIIKFLLFIPLLRFFVQYALIFFNVIYIACRFNIEKFDLIHGHSSFYNGFSAYFIAKIYKKPFIYDIHAFQFDAYSKKNLRYKWDKHCEGFLIKKATRVIVIDELLKKHIIELFHCNPTKIFVAPNGVDGRKFFKISEPCIEKIKKSLKLSDDNLIIGVDHSKPIENFIFIEENINKIIEAFPKVKILVFGSKKRLHVKHEIFIELPLIAPEEINNYFNILDVFIFTRSKNQQTDTITPLKLLELWCAETPTIVSDVDGLTCCNVDERLIYAPNQIDDLLNKMDFVFNNKILIQSIVEERRMWVLENKKWAQTSDVYLNCYHEIIQK